MEKPIKQKHKLLQLYLNKVNSVRPRPNMILWERFSNFATTGFYHSNIEIINDSNKFMYIINFNANYCQNSTYETVNSTEKIIQLIVLCRNLAYIWESGGKDLISHFFNQSNGEGWKISLIDESIVSILNKVVIWNHKSFDGCLVSIQNNIDNSDGIRQLLNLFTHSLSITIQLSSLLRNSESSECLAKKIAYTPYFLLIGPIFKILRQTVYTNLYSTIEFKLRENESVVIISDPQQFQFIISDHKMTEDPSLCLFINDIIQTVQLVQKNLNNLKDLYFIKNSKLKELLDTISKNNIELKCGFSYQLIPNSIKKCLVENNMLLLTHDRVLFINFIHCLGNITESRLLSIAKIVIGLREYLINSFKIYKEYTRHNIDVSINKLSLQIK